MGKGFRIDGGVMEWVSKTIFSWRVNKMNVKKIWSHSLGFDKGSYIEVEHLDGRLQKIGLRRDKKRLNQGTLSNQFYFLVDGNRIYANQIQVIK